MSAIISLVGLKDLPQCPCIARGIQEMTFSSASELISVIDLSLSLTPGSVFNVFNLNTLAFPRYGNCLLLALFTFF